jgi:hypothetical protein
MPSRPAPVDSVYPVLLDDLPAPRLRAYPTYTVVAEKLHAIALLGMTNSRLKDYFDLSVLLERETLDTALLAKAIKATFERRGMAVPDELPIGLTDEFAHDASRQSLWLAFLKKNELAPEPLAAIVEPAFAVEPRHRADGATAMTETKGSACTAAGRAKPSITSLRRFSWTSRIRRISWRHRHVGNATTAFHSTKSIWPACSSA